MSMAAVAKKHGDVDATIFVTRFEFDGVRFMEQIGIEQNDAVLRIGDHHFSAIVFCKKLPDAFICFVINIEVPVQRSLFLVHNQATIFRI